MFSSYKQAFVAAILSLGLVTLVRTSPHALGNSSWTPPIEEIRESIIAESNLVSPERLSAIEPAVLPPTLLPKQEPERRVALQAPDTDPLNIAGLQIPPFDSWTDSFGSWRKTWTLGMDQTDELEQLVAQEERNVPAPIFLELAARVLSRNDVERAAHYYAEFQLRSQFDLRRCADESASNGIALLLLRYKELASRIPDDRRTVALRSLVDDNPPQPTASPLWACTRAAHGRLAAEVGELITPATSWPAIWADVVERSRSSLRT